MKINVLQDILDYDGKPINTSIDPQKPVNLAWRAVIFNALNSVAKDEVLTGEEKARCYRITAKVYDSKEPELTVEERSFLLGRIRKVYISPLICGRAEEFFEEAKSETIG